MKANRLMKLTTKFFVIVTLPLATGLALAPLASNAAPAGVGSRSPVLKPPVAAAAPAGWAIPRLGPPGRQWDDGRSGLGSVQILVEPDAGERGPASKTRTRFGVVKIGANGKPIAGVPRVIELAGKFGFDAISNDGSRLFVTENRDVESPGTYRVRVVDVGNGALDPRIISEQRINTEAFVDAKPTAENLMYGYAVKRVRNEVRTHWIFTLYDANGKYPFVHALNTEGWALCVDLPRHGKKTADLDAFWDLRATTDTVFVSNAKLKKAWSFPIGSTALSSVPAA
jgi:hypothetical protein